MMNVKNYLTLAGIIGLIYGLWFFLIPDQAAECYGMAEAQTDMSRVLLKFLGATVLAGGVLALAGRGASKSIGRTAILYYMAVSQLLYLFLNIMGLSAGASGTMNYIDLIVNVILGFGAVYFILQDRKSND